MGKPGGESIQWFHYWGGSWRSGHGKAPSMSLVEFLACSSVQRRLFIWIGGFSGDIQYVKRICKGFFRGEVGVKLGF